VFCDTEAEVPRIVELRRRDVRQGKRRLEEIACVLIAKGDLRADRIALTDAEVGFGPFCLRTDAL